MHIVADKNVSPFAPARNICCGHKFHVRDTKNVSDFVQKHFVSATNVSQFAQPKKHHEQQCVRNNACVLVCQGLNLYSHFPKAAATDEEQEHSNNEDTERYSD